MLSLGPPSGKKRQEKEKKKGPRSHTAKSIHPSFLPQIEN